MAQDAATEFLEFLASLAAPFDRQQVPTDQQFKYRDARHLVHHTRDQIGNWIGDLFERTNAPEMLVGPAEPGDQLTVVGECDHERNAATVTVRHGDRVVMEATFTYYQQ
jgi:hypothetical protein